jgi:hypothetical protein
MRLASQTTRSRAGRGSVSRSALPDDFRHLDRERRWPHGRRTLPMVGEFGVAARTNYKLLLEYDGSAYHGWQRQRGVLTIQEVVETRMAIMTCEPVALIGAGRTDAGVHARPGPGGRGFSRPLPGAEQTLRVPYP